MGYISEVQFQQAPSIAIYHITMTFYPPSPELAHDDRSTLLRSKEKWPEKLCRQWGLSLRPCALLLQQATNLTCILFRSFPASW